MKSTEDLKPIEPKLRIASALDVPAVWCLLDDYKDTFLEDGGELDRRMIIEMVQAQRLIVAHDGGRPWAVFYVSDIKSAQNSNLHGTLHFLCRPNRLRDVLKHDLFATFIDKAFMVYNIRKLKAVALEPQSTAYKFLVRHRFFKVGKLLNETLFHGKPINVYMFELQRHYWEKYRNKRNVAGFDRSITDGRAKRNLAELAPKPVPIDDEPVHDGPIADDAAKPVPDDGQAHKSA